MRFYKSSALSVFALLVVLVSFSSAFSETSQPSPVGPGEPGAPPAEQEKQAGEVIIVSDPLEPYNRVMYQFNDKFYFWVLKPTAKGYRKVVPEPARKSVRNFFLNLTTPVRLVNNGLQGKFRQSGVELARFFINTTWGVAGLFDPAKSRMNLPLYEEDFDQTLGMYGLGSGIYIIWPFWGPSSLRGTAGIVGDLAMDPVFYLTLGTNFAYTGVTAYRMVNETSLTIGDYESLKEAAIDPYIALRDAYFQNRRGKIKE